MYTPFIKSNNFKKPLPIKKDINSELLKVENRIVNEITKDINVFKATVVNEIDSKLLVLEQKLERNLALVNPTIVEAKEIMKEMASTTEYVVDLIDSTKQEALDIISHAKGEDGQDGQDANIEEIIEYIDNIPQIDPVELEQSILSKIPKIDEKSLSKKILANIPKSSLKIIQEKIEVDPVSIARQIMSLPEDKFKLKTTNIDGLEQTMSAFRSQLGRSYLHGGGDTIVAGTGITIVSNANGTKTISTSGGSGSVTTVSVVTANGLSGSVANPTTTPAITLDINALDATKIGSGTVDNTEYSYLNGVTSSIQSQLNSKELALTFSTGLNRTGNTITNTITEFTDLSDVPASYTGQALKAIRVNAGASALEFYTPSGGGSTITEVEIDFGTSPVVSKRFIISDAGITSLSKIMVSPSGSVATGRVGNDWEWDTINFSALSGTGQFTLTGTASGRIKGRRKVYYTYN